MQPAALKPLEATIALEAQRAVAQARGAGWVEAMSTLASHLPITVVADLVGPDSTGRARMLQWETSKF